MEVIKLRRKDKALSDEVAEQILKNTEYGILCLASKHGGYGIPMVYAYEENKIWIHGGAIGRKNDDIKHDDRVCFTVVDDVEMDAGRYITKNRSVMAFGRIREVHDQERQDGLNAFLRKRGIEPSNEPSDENKKHRATVFCIDIEYMTAKGRTKY